MKRWKETLILVVSVAAILLSFLRLFFGIDLTDEGQYLAQSIGPIFGGEIFVTDRFFQQSGSLLATPFLWIFTKVTGSTDGIVIFFRILYFAICLLTSFVLFKALRIQLGKIFSFALSILPVLYIPFSIPAITYNTMAIQMTVMFFALWRIAKLKPNGWIMACLAFVGAMGPFCYPPLLIAYFLFFVWQFFRFESRQFVVKVMAVTFIFSLLLASLVFQIGFQEIEKNMLIAKAVSLFSSQSKWDLSLIHLKLFRPGPLYWILLCFGVGYLAVKKRPFELLAIPLFALFFLTLAPYLQVEVNFGFLVYAIVITLGLKCVQKRVLKESWTLLVEILFALFIGVLMALTSTNGLINAALGFSIALIFIFESHLLKYLKFPLVAWLMVVFVYSFGAWTLFYREGRLSELKTQISSGPYRFIWTGSQKASFLNNMENDLASLPPTAQTLLSYDAFPSGYLFRALRPMTFMYFVHPAVDNPSLRPFLVEMFVSNQMRPDAVIETDFVPISEGVGVPTQDLTMNKFNDPFWGYFRHNPDYQLFTQRPGYSIFLRRALVLQDK